MPFRVEGILYPSKIEGSFLGMMRNLFHSLSYLDKYRNLKNQILKVWRVKFVMPGRSRDEKREQWSGISETNKLEKKQSKMGNQKKRSLCSICSKVETKYFLPSSWNPWSWLCEPEVIKELALGQLGNKSPVLKASVQLQTHVIVYLALLAPHRIYFKWEWIIKISWSNFQHACSWTKSIPYFTAKV